MSNRFPTILYVTSSWPHGQTYGGQLRALHVGRAMHKVGEVTLVVVSSDIPNSEATRLTTVEFRNLSNVCVKMVRNPGLTQRLRWALDPRYLNVHGCVVEEPDRARLLCQLDEFDLIWVQNSRTPNILNQWSWPHSVLDIDDVPSTYQRTVWRNGTGLREKFKAGAKTLLLKRRELRLKDRFTALAVCSEGDRQYLGGGRHIHVIPNGFERPAQCPVPSLANPTRIGFIGLYSYPPNLEGVRWFFQNCWRQVKREAHFRLVGKDTDGPLKPDAPDVDALGWVAHPAAEIATWSAMIIPVRHGAGTRVKVADAFSRKCPVVATRLGAYGYDVEHGRELLLADDPAGFAAACISLIREPANAAAMAERAYAAFLKNWTWDAIAPRVWATAKEAMSGKR